MGPVVDRVGFGCKKVLSEEHTCFFDFHDFANIQKERGDKVASPHGLCHGRKWSVLLYPFGNNKSTEGYITVFLKAVLENDDDEVKAKFRFKIRDMPTPWVTRTFKHGLVATGISDFIKRSDILDSTNNILVDGTLTIQVDIQIYTDSPAPWVPKKRLGCDMLKMLNSGTSRDVTFTINKDEFRAHHCVLECRAPVLASLAEDFRQNDNPIQLGSDLDPNIFKVLLHFAYTDELPSDVDVSKDAQKLLDMADKFGCVALKLLAESEMIKLGITTENFADLLLYADAKNCPLLREAAMNFTFANISAATETKGWDALKESPQIMSEITEMTVGRKRRKLTSESDGHVDFDNISIATLREKSCELGLDEDGSREVLVKRLVDAMGLKK